MLARRPFGNTDLAVSPLAIAGSFGIDAAAVERAFHEQGVSTYFVTPRMKGLCQGIRRLVAAGHRDELTLCSVASVPTGFFVRRAWESTARALGVEAIDVWLLAWVQARWYVTGKTWPAMQRLKDEGKARALGISCHDRPMARELVDECRLDALMIRYNAAHRGAEKEIFASLPAERPGVIAYTATRWGKLLSPTGGLGPMTAPECYRFALGHPAVDTVLCGARDWNELEANLRGVGEGPLAPERAEEVRAFGDAVRATATGRVGFWGG